MQQLSIIKRDGRSEKFNSGKILTHLYDVADGLKVDTNLLLEKIQDNIYDNMRTSEIDELTANIAYDLCYLHYDYAKFASYIFVGNLHKIINAKDKYAFFKMCKEQYDNYKPLLRSEILYFVEVNKDWFDEIIKYNRDYKLAYPGLLLMKTMYLKRCGKFLLNEERSLYDSPQNVFMRSAIEMFYKPDWTNETLEMIKKTYNLISKGCVMFATPNLLNSCTPSPQLSSCFLLTIPDSIDGQADYWKNIAKCFKYAGGVGSTISSVRAKRSYISGTDGFSTGLKPLLKVNESIALYVDQCIGLDTLIYSKLGIAEARHIVEGDYLLDENGDWNRVMRVLHNTVNQYYTITTTHDPKPVIITPEHPLLVKKDDNTIDYVKIKDMRTSYKIILPSHIKKTEEETQILAKKLGYTYESSPDWSYLTYFSAQRIRGFLLELGVHSKITMEDGYYSITPTQEANYITSIKLHNKTIEVLDFEMEGQKNYITQLGVVHNGGGKRKGSLAIYIEMWHPDIFDFLNSQDPNVPDAHGSKNLFPALWICDEFFRCLKKEEEFIVKGYKARLWALINPQKYPELIELYDEDLSTEYIDDNYLEKNKDRFKFTYRYRQIYKSDPDIIHVSATEIWKRVCDITEQRGIPYKCFKDSANRKSNQKNIGTLRTSNLCTEIYEYTDDNEIAVCNLASICVNKYYRNDTFDYEKLKSDCRHVCRCLNNVIDCNFYPVEDAKKSNMKSRPIGLGVQGLADLFSKMKVAYDSEKAKLTNFYIFEAIYFACLSESCKLAKETRPYPSYSGSPLSNGLFHFDLSLRENAGPTPIYADLAQDWTKLAEQIAQYGVRNSLFVACMPTGSTSIIFGNSPSIEPHNGLIFKKRNKTGELIIINKYLQKELIKRKLWSKEIYNKILSHSTSSIQEIDEIPDEVKSAYKTVWDMSPKAIIDQAYIRSPFVDQGQSMNLFIEQPNRKILTQIAYYAWRRGLKTGSYYTRRKPPKDARKLQIREDVSALSTTELEECVVCSS